MADDNQDLGGTAQGIIDAPVSPQIAAPATKPTAAPDLAPAFDYAGKAQEQLGGAIGREQTAMQDRDRVPIPQAPKIGQAPQHDIRGEAMARLGFATALGGIAPRAEGEDDPCKAAIASSAD